MNTTMFGLPWELWGGLCLGLGLLYSFLHPKPQRPDNPRPAVQLRWFFLRWGHALVWLLLAGACFVRAAQLGLDIVSNLLAILALLCYMTFVALLVNTRPAPRK